MTDEIQVPLPDELVELIGALNTAGGELPEVLRDLLAQQILFMPPDLGSKPPEHFENMLDMFDEGLNRLIDICGKNIVKNPDVERIDMVQGSLNRLAVTGFSVDEIAALLSVALDRLARQQVANKEDRDWQHKANLESLRVIAEKREAAGISDESTESS